MDGAVDVPCLSGFTPPSDLSDGEHTITVRAMGLGATTSSTAVVRVDNTPPVTTITGGPPPFTNAIVSYPMQLSVDEAGVRVECRLDGELIDADCAEHPFFNSHHGRRARGVDRGHRRLGNVGAPAEHRWTIDRVSPS